MGSDEQTFYLVRRKGNGVYERLTRKEIDRGLASGEIEERAVSGWVGEDGRLVFSEHAKEYVRKR